MKQGKYVTIKMKHFQKNYLSHISFNKGELRHLYRGFKAECPSGVLTEECFHYVYTSFFPGRDEAYNGGLTFNMLRL